MYKDQIYKLEYYKQRLIGKSLALGEYLNEGSLFTALDDYETQFSLFKHKYIQSGSKLDVKDFNNELSVLYNDLLILYKVVYEITVTNFNKTKEIISIKLNDLERIADQYYSRCKLETIAIFGDTLVYQAGNFDITNKNGKSYIQLPEFTTYEGATLAFLANIENLENANAVLELTPSQNIQNYESNENLFIVPGSPEIKTKFFELDSSNKYNGSFMLEHNPDNAYQNQYYIYSGKDMMFVNGKYISISEYNKTEYTGIYDIELYIYNATQADFNFSLEPIKSNIDNHYVTIKDRVQKFTFRMQPYSHLSIQTNGIVFCAVDKCRVKENKLYSKTFYENVYSYMLETISYNKEVVYEKPVAVIDNPTNKEIKIKSLAVKQNRYSDYDQVQY